MTSQENQEGKTSQTLTEHSRFGFLIYPFKVIVFPFKALREITNSQSLTSILPGFFLVIALHMVVTTGTAYVRASKIFLDSGTQSASLLGADFLGAILLPTLLQSLLGFILSWVTYAGILFLIAKFLGKKSMTSNIFLTVVGYTFSVLVIYGATTTLLVSFLPEIHFAADIWYSGTPEEVGSAFNAVWGPTLAYRVMDYLGLVFMFWLVFLGAIIVRVTQELSLMMAIILSLAAYFTSSMLTAFISLFM